MFPGCFVSTRAQRTTAVVAVVVVAVVVVFAVAVVVAVVLFGKLNPRGARPGVRWLWVCALKGPHAGRVRLFPAAGAAWKSAGPKASERPGVLARVGACFFWVLFFARAKKS